MAATIDRTDIERVYSVIQPYIRKTPVVVVAGGDFGLEQARVVVKLELLQRAGSFKTRGAFANLLTRPVPPAGVVAASGGNHGAAVAFAALQVHAFDQRETLLGQGTVGLELAAQAPELDTLLVAVGGGGLVGGIAAWY